LKPNLGALFDGYTRVARVYPALISLAPVIWTAAAVAPNAFTESTLRVGLTAAVGLGGIALLANLARSRGKEAESVLLVEWDGWPTTRFLRHRNAIIDPFTKARYHAKLQQLSPDLSLPNEGDERRDPRRADDVYRSATARLLELRRGPDYKLLQGENAQYGFRRNLLGLKPVALSLVAASIAVTSVTYWSPFGAGLARPPLFAAWLGDFCFVLVFALIVRKEFVRQAADEYALSLLRTLDENEGKNASHAAQRV